MIYNLFFSPSPPLSLLSLLFFSFILLPYSSQLFAPPPPLSLPPLLHLNFFILLLSSPLLSSPSPPLPSPPLPSVSQWCSWAARSTPLKTALMLSSRSMEGLTMLPLTVRGPSSSLTSRGKASKRLLTGEEASEAFYFFIFALKKWTPRELCSDLQITHTTFLYSWG